MKPEAHVGVAFGSKLLRPCRKLLLVFRLRKTLAIRRARASPSRATSKRASSPLERLVPISAFVSVIRSLKKKMSARGRLKDRKAKSSKIGKVISASAISDSGCERLLFPSPITPAASSAIHNAPSKSLKRSGWDSYEDGGDGVDEVEDACRSFENYLVGMIAEEGKVRDLMDVEELLFCWKNLKCPVFIGLVSRFYGELCRDLFAATDDEDDGVSSQ
ncbi:transcription repressor OFP17 [Rhodamnia argentea]|uniref:Transcription repressor OFP17 n=1 Tax=Rhodamnia argentea TaxID=178133 RepID=A0A8B8NQ76_9MYRT|nr:transcription repressor OFP17 [Rhodamnia argentea]